MVFEHLRGGKLNEIQKKLKHSGNHEVYLWLTGSQPFFDNIAYAQTTELDDLLLGNQNFDRISHLNIATQSVQYGGCESNVTLGNRMNNLFLETCLDRIKNHQAILEDFRGQPDENIQKKKADFECAILAHQSG